MRLESNSIRMDRPSGGSSLPKSTSSQAQRVAVDSSSSSDGASVPLTRHPDLIMVKDTPKGRGVFATAPIPARTILDVSPVLVLDPDEVKHHTRHTKLWFYTYNWHPPGASPTQALPLGLGSLFNHASSRSRAHNTGFMRDAAAETITYLTLRDVCAGEELCICYGEDARLGFLDADAEVVNGHDEQGQALADMGVENVDVRVFQDGP